MHEVLVNCVFKLAQEKVWLGELTVTPWPWLLTLDVKQQNKLSVIKGRVYLGWTSTKLGLMCLAQGHNTMTGEAQTRGPSVSSQALYHWATAHPHIDPFKITPNLSVVVLLIDQATLSQSKMTEETNVKLQYQFLSVKNCYESSTSIRCTVTIDFYTTGWLLLVTLNRWEKENIGRRSNTNNNRI